jgi:hypothetical protein
MASKDHTIRMSLTVPGSVGAIIESHVAVAADDADAGEGIFPNRSRFVAEACLAFDAHLKRQRLRRYAALLDVDDDDEASYACLRP